VQQIGKYLRFLLLPAILFWSVGATQFVHEMTEHAGHARWGVHDDDADVENDSAAESAAIEAKHAGHEHEHGRKHDHEHCAACMMLAVIKSGPGVFVATPPPTFESVGMVRLDVADAPYVSSAVQLPPSRAPPAAISL
jgi:hypothetical protein